jgi:hypothetical protein
MNQVNERSIIEIMLFKVRLFDKFEISFQASKWFIKIKETN